MEKRWGVVWIGEKQQAYTQRKEKCSKTFYRTSKNVYYGIKTRNEFEY